MNTSKMPQLYDTLTQPAVVARLKDGAVGVLPTDTVYGLVCAAHLTASAARLYELKSREQKPGTIIAASVDDLVGLGLRRRYLTAVAEFWPSSLSVVVPVEGIELSHLEIGKGSLAVRIPADEVVLSLLRQTGPLLTTSANQPGRPPATTVTKAQDYFGESVDFYVDGGDLSNRQPSTIIRIVDDAIELIRQGAVIIDESGRISQ